MDLPLAICDDTLAIAESSSAVVSLDDLVHQHSRFVFRIAYAVLRNTADAEDATQDCFLRALKHESELAGIQDHKAWLARIAWRVSCDRAKSRKPQEDASVLDDLPLVDSDIEQAVISDQLRAHVNALIEALPSDLRAVVLLSTVDEMTSSEVAVVLDIPEGSVRTRLMRARQVLKQKLAARLSRSR